MNAPKPKPARGPLHWIGCLVQVPLGCLAFLVGALVVLFAFLPFATGSLLGTWASEEFSKARIGDLEVTDAWLGSFYGSQEIGGVTMRDGDGREVLRGSLDAPSLRTLFFSSDPEWGPVRVHLELVDLTREPNGGWRLFDALERDPSGTEPDPKGRRVVTSHSSSTSTSFRKSILVELVVDRLITTDATGSPFEIRDLACRGSVRVRSSEETGQEVVVGFDGTGRGTFDGDPGRSIGLAWHLEGGESGIEWRVSFDTERVERAIVLAVAPGLDHALEDAPLELNSFHAALGQEAKDQPLRLSVRADAQGVGVALSADLDLATASLRSAPADRIRLVLDGRDAVGERIARDLVPFIAGFGGDGREAVSAEVRVDDFVVDLAARPILPRANLVLDFQDALLRVEPEFRGVLPLGSTTRLAGPGRMRFADGRRAYLELKFDAVGGILTVRGAGAGERGLDGLELDFPGGEVRELRDGADGLVLSPPESR